MEKAKKVESYEERKARLERAADKTEVEESVSAVKALSLKDRLLKKTLGVPGCHFIYVEEEIPLRTLKANERRTVLTKLAAFEGIQDDDDPEATGRFSDVLDDLIKIAGDIILDEETAEWVKAGEAPDKLVISLLMFSIQNSLSLGAEVKSFRG